jgi:hypothetical protein
MVDRRRTFETSFGASIFMLDKEMVILCDGLTLFNLLIHKISRCIHMINMTIYTSL